MQNQANQFLVVLTIVGFGLLSNVSPQCLTDTVNPTGYHIREFNKGQLQFTTDLLLTLNQLSPYENVFVSPHSIYNTFLLAYFGSQKATKTTFEKVLHLNWTAKKEDVMRTYRFQKQIRARQSTNNDLEFLSADRVYFSPDIPVNTCLKRFLVNELDTLDFQRQADASRRQINAWVEGVTRNMITELLPPGTITSQTHSVLANAAYFKGKWETTFNTAKTVSDLFYPIVGTPTKMPMMSVKSEFKLTHSDALGCRILDLPYAPSNETQISMIILLPDDFLVETILRRLTPELLEAALQEDNEHEVELKMPKFTVEKTMDLRPLVSQMGFDIFSPSADFSDFSNKSVSFDEGVHKAKIEIDENGSTAAAATAVFGFRSGFTVEVEKFDCNYPFVYIIFDHKEKSALFAGIYRGPEV